MVCIAGILTYLIPAGEFNRAKDAAGHLIIVAGTFHAVAAHPLPIYEIPLELFKVLLKASDIVFFIFVIGGTFEIITRTKMIDAFMERLSFKLQGHESWVIPIFLQWHRLTGTSEADKAAAYIMEQLKAYHIACERYEFDGYFSDPVKSELVVADTIIPSKPRSCSLNCPQGIAGEVIYDDASKGVCATKNEEHELYSQFRGKIVLSWNFYEDYVKKLEAYGAIGLIHFWTSKEDVLHEETVCSVEITGIPCVQRL